MTDTLFRDADVIELGDLVVYHGSITALHGLWLAVPCQCGNCKLMDEMGLPNVRFALVDPWGEEPGPEHVRRTSVSHSRASV